MCIASTVPILQPVVKMIECRDACPIVGERPDDASLPEVLLILQHVKRQPAVLQYFSRHSCHSFFLPLAAGPDPVSLVAIRRNVIAPATSHGFASLFCAN